MGRHCGSGNRRDAGFTIFYMGINIGATLAALTCGYLGETFGWAYGFGLAGIGMLSGLITFVRGQHLFFEAGHPPQPELLRRSVGGFVSRETLVYLLAIVAVAAGSQSLAVYTQTFEGVAEVAGIALLLLVPLLRRRMHLGNL